MAKKQESSADVGSEGTSGASLGISNIGVQVINKFNKAANEVTKNGIVNNIAKSLKAMANIGSVNANLNTEIGQGVNNELKVFGNNAKEQNGSKDGTQKPRSNGRT